MGAFGGFTLTNKGRNLQAKAQAGAVLNYTRAAIGDGTLTGQSIVALTALISPKKTLPITKLRMIPPDRAAVGTIISNQSITTGFYFREIGIFAQDPDEGEILYAYANSGANAEYLPPAGGPDVIEKSIDMLVVVGRASQVTATIDSSLVFPTFAEMEDAIEEALASVKVPLVDSNTSTSKTEAPTADALRRTVESTAEALALKQNVLRLADNYLAASVLVNAAPDGSGRSYPDGVSMFKVSTSAGGWPASNGYVLTFRAGSGGYQIFYEMYTGAVASDKTARQWTRSKRDSNGFWQAWAQTLTEVDLVTHNADYVRQPGYVPVTRNSSDVYVGTLSPAPLTPNALPDGFAVTIVPDVANTTTTPKLQLNNGSIIQIRRNPTTDFAIGAIKAGVPLALIKVGSYFLARSAAPVGTATAAQVLSGVTFQSEAVPDGGVGTLPQSVYSAYTTGASSMNLSPGQVVNLSTFPGTAKGVMFSRHIASLTSEAFAMAGDNYVELQVVQGSTIVKIPRPYPTTSYTLSYQNLIIEPVEKFVYIRTYDNSAPIKVSVSAIDFSKPFTVRLFGVTATNNDSYRFNVSILSA